MKRLHKKPGFSLSHWIDVRCSPPHLNCASGRGTPRQTHHCPAGAQAVQQYNSSSSSSSRVEAEASVYEPHAQTHICPGGCKLQTNQLCCPKSWVAPGATLHVEQNVARCIGPSQARSCMNRAVVMSLRPERHADTTHTSTFHTTAAVCS